MARGPNPASQAQASLGLVPGTKYFSPFPFSGMNTLGSPISIDDKEFPYIENFFRLGDGKLRTAYDVGRALYTATVAGSIVSFFPFTIGTDFFFAVFFSDGSALQVAYPTGAITPIAPAGHFFVKGGVTPACTQWGVLYLLIANRNTKNDYWAWDGHLLYGAGTIAPNGVTLTSGGKDYTTVPVATPFGGSGTGVVLQPVINAGSVVNVKIVNPGTGYEVGDIVQAQFSGGGSDTGPIAQVSLQKGGVAAVNITGPGSGYTSAPTVGFSGGGGTGAAATATIGSGVSSVTMTNTGANYTNATVSFSGGGGSGAIASANIVGGQITSITIIDPGTGYTAAPTVTFAGDGTGAAGTAAIVGAGVITVTMTAPGTGYTSAPTVTFTGGSPTVAATGVAVLNAEQLSAVTLVNAGTGFLYAPLVSFVGGGGTGAAGYALLVSTSVQRVDMLSPGQNYQKNPNVVFFGGPVNVGSAKATAVMNGQGGVGNVNLTNGGTGYGAQPEVVFVPQKNDPGSGATARAILAASPLSAIRISNFGLDYTSAPAIVVAPGANNAAYATIDLMPFGLSGACIETFLARVWIANPAFDPLATIPPGGDLSITAPGSITDVAASAGGLIFTNSDAFLQTQYVAIKQSNGYIYFLGDGSVSVGSNVQTSGNPLITTFNYQTVDPQVGCSWRDSCVDFGKTILFANQTGVYGIYGGAVTKVSQKMDDIFVNAVFPPDTRAVTPSGAVAHIFDVKHYFLLMTIRDPDLGTLRNVMLGWNEREWVVSSQSVSLTYIATQKINSVQQAWGTDGSAIYPLFNQPSATLTKRLDTKAFGTPQSYMVKQLDGLYIQANDKSGTGAGIEMGLSFEISGKAVQSAFSGQAPSGIYQVPASVTWQSADPFWAGYGQPPGGVGQPGASPIFVSCSARLTTTSPDFVLGNLVLTYRDIAADR